jgi:hypothetical protein
MLPGWDSMRPTAINEIEGEALPQARVEGVAQAVTEEVECQHGDENG